MNRRTFLSASGSGAALLAATPHAGATTVSNANGAQRIAPDPTPLALTLPNVVLRTQDNRKVRLYEDLLKDKIFLINMFLITCTDGSCPLVTANLARVQPLLGKRLGRDIFMYSISLDPERDTPESLRAYAAFFKVKPGWLFLTGEKPDEIEQLRIALGFRDPDPEQDALKTTHSMAVMGNEPLDRWAGCPLLGEPREVARVLGYLDWPKGWRGRRAGVAS